MIEIVFILFVETQFYYFSMFSESFPADTEYAPRTAMILWIWSVQELSKSSGTLGEVPRLFRFSSTWAFSNRLMRTCGLIFFNIRTSHFCCIYSVLGDKTHSQKGSRTARGHTGGLTWWHDNRSSVLGNLQGCGSVRFHKSVVQFPARRMVWSPQMVLFREHSVGVYHIFAHFSSLELGWSNLFLNIFSIFSLSRLVAAEAAMIHCTTTVKHGRVVELQQWSEDFSVQLE